MVTAIASLTETDRTIESVPEIDLSNREVQSAFSPHHCDAAKSLVKATAADHYRCQRIRFATLDLVSVCDNNCVRCIDKNSVNQPHLPREIPWPLVFAIIADLVALGCVGIEPMGGESMLYSKYGEFLRLLAEYGIAVRIVTNGRHIHDYVPEIKAAMRVPHSSIRISCNGGPKTYSQVTGAPSGEYAQVLLPNIEKIADVGPGISFVVFPENYHELAQVARDVKEHGAAYMIVLPGRDVSTKEVLDRTAYAGALDEQCAQASALSDARFRVIIPHTTEACPHQPKDYPLCLSSFLKPLISVNRDVYPCGYLRGRKEFAIGRVTAETSLLDFWRSTSRVAAACHLDPSIHCSGIVCTKHCLNTALWRLKEAATPAEDLPHFPEGGFWF